MGEGDNDHLLSLEHLTLISEYKAILQHPVENATFCI